MVKIHSNDFTSYNIIQRNYFKCPCIGTIHAKYCAFKTEHFTTITNIEIMVKAEYIYTSYNTDRQTQFTNTKMFKLLKTEAISKYNLHKTEN